MAMNIPVLKSRISPHARKRDRKATNPDNAIEAIANHVIFKIFLMDKSFFDITIYSIRLYVKQP